MLLVRRPMRPAYLLGMTEDVEHLHTRLLDTGAGILHAPCCSDLGLAFRAHVADGAEIAAADTRRLDAV